MVVLGCTGAGSSRLLSSGQSYWTHAYDRPGISDTSFSSYQEYLSFSLGVFFRLLNNHYSDEIQGEKDDKIIAVCADDPEYRHYNDIKDLPPHRLAEIRRFFEDCILSKYFKMFVQYFLYVSIYMDVCVCIYNSEMQKYHLASICVKLFFLFPFIKEL